MREPPPRVLSSQNMEEIKRFEFWFHFFLVVVVVVVGAEDACMRVLMKGWTGGCVAPQWCAFPGIS